MDADVIVVGSGPSGAHAAKQALDMGLSVLMLDMGHDAPQARSSVPEGSFSELRRSDERQRTYFLGQSFHGETQRNDRLGAHFTAPRAFITEQADALIPVRSNTFFPVQSLALGGLGAGWGAGSPTFEPFELESAGIPAQAISRFYDEVIREIGVSAGSEDDTAPFLASSRFVQTPAQIDDNARTIFRAYEQRREALRSRGFALGRAPLALLTEPIVRDGVTRGANPYTDMDFYGEASGSIYRPRYTIEALQQQARFRYVGGALVRAFAEDGDGVRVFFTDRSGASAGVSGKRLLLAAGALNTARIVLRARNLTGVRLPLLCNPMSFLACINLRMLGRAAQDRRHSLAQLAAVYTPQHRAPEHVIAAIYSYRALLHYRLIKDLPLPIFLGLPAARLVSTSLTIAGVHHPERRSADKWIALSEPDGDALTAHYELSAEERELIDRDLRGLAGCLRHLGCIPAARLETPAGSSIHYAGTIPIQRTGERAPLTTDERGKLIGSDRVFLADSSPWRALPAKGPTLTLMANARRVAFEAATELRVEARS